MEKFSEEQKNQLLGAQMRGPVSLRDLDPSRPFVYDRRFGAFYVPYGRHPQAMSLLLAFHHEQADGIDVAALLGLEYSSETADAWLRDQRGTAYKSSVGNGIQAGRPGSLSAGELRCFGEVAYIFTGDHQ